MNDHQRIETFLTGNSVNVLFSSANLVIFSAVLAIFNPYIFTVFIAASLLYAIWVTLFLRKRKALDYRRFEVTAKEQSATIQLVFGMQDIKLNGVERPMRWTWEHLQAKLFKLNMKGLALNQWQQSGASFINEGKNILITFIAAKAVIDGQMTLGTMLAVQYIMGQLNSPIEQMIGFIQSWQNAKISLDRLNEIHGMEDEEPADKPLLQELPVAYSRLVAGGRDAAAPGMPEDLAEIMPVHHPEPLPHPQPPEESITFSNVSFAYPGAGNTPVLRDIHLKIPKGRTTAIVGVSGSGKTTLLKLMLKFYEPQKGEIRLNDVPLSTISHKSWRSHCGAVMQESFIFSESIAYNIAVGLDKPDRKRLEYAAAIANIQEFVASLPMGFSTKIGAEGMGISMGQKQRILIARAVYRNPDFIFFDEATNSLDANNESEIVHNLKPFLSGRTVVVVAHRLSTVRNADQIVVLNKGIIAEKGTHQELVNLKGEYYTLVKNQLELGE
jgi:ATP-binding cassette subfamily B protein